MPPKTSERDDMARKRIATELRLANSIGYQLHHADKAVEAGMRLRLAQFNVPIGMYFYLRALWLEDGLSQAALSRRVKATPATTALQLRRMELRGLIRREDSFDDKRKQHVFLTDLGRSLEEPLLEQAFANREDAFRGFSKEEIRLTLELIARIQENMAGQE